MKINLKYCLLVFVILLVLCGFKYSDREGDEIPSDGQQIETFYYKGHSYVCYRFYTSSKMFRYGYGGASIVHDPDCKCGKGGGR